MGPFGLQELVLVVSILGLSLLGATVLIAPPLRRALFSMLLGPDTALRKARLEQLQRQAKYLSKKVHLLEDQSTEYFHVFHASGWNEILRAHENIVVAIDDLRAYLASRDFGPFDILLDYLLESRFSAKDLSGLTPADLQALTDWQQRADVLIVKMIDELSKAAAENREAGVVRARKKKATVEALSELQVLLHESVRARQSAGLGDSSDYPS